MMFTSQSQSRCRPQLVLRPNFLVTSPVAKFGFVLIVLSLCLTGQRECNADKYRPGDPLASIDGTPVYLGELNLLLVQRLKLKNLDEVPVNVQRATAALLVQQHLALKSLREQGGKAIEGIIDREIAVFEQSLRRRGRSLEKHAQSIQSTENAVRDHLSWQVAWREYLKSRMTDSNLRKFYDRNRDRYSGGQWDVSQIFLSVDPNDPNSVGIANQRMEGIVGDLRQAADVGKAFAEIAKTESEGGSASEGGRLGWVKDGDVPKPVMDSIRKLPPGTLSEPIPTALGKHLVLVHGQKPSDLPFEKLRDQSAVRRDAADALFKRLIAKQSSAKVVWYISALMPPPASTIGATQNSPNTLSP